MLILKYYIKNTTFCHHYISKLWSNYIYSLCVWFTVFCFGIYTEDQRCRQFLIQTRYNSTECTHRDTSHRKKRSPYAHCITYEGVKLEIKASTQGYSKLIWEIPAYIIENSKYVHIDICQNTHSSDTSEVHALVRKQFHIHKSSGA